MFSNWQEAFTIFHENSTQQDPNSKIIIENRYLDFIIVFNTLSVDLRKIRNDHGCDFSLN